MWMLLALITVAGAKSPIKDKKCPVYSAPRKPVDCGPNAYWENCPPQCPPHQNCSLLWSKFQCIPDEDYCCKPACRCKDTFYRDDNFKCVTSKQCKPISNPCQKCKGPNEIWVKCKTICPPQSCDISYTTYLCQENQECEPGCDCIKDYLRLTNGTCVKNDDCPPPPSTEPPTEPECGYNEVRVPCPQICPPQDCEALYLEYLCAARDDSVPCEPGCNCKENHLRNASKICVPIAECPPGPRIVPIQPHPPITVTEPPKNDCRTNETFVNCAVRCGPYDTCPVDDSRAIIVCDPPNPCPPGCVCKIGYRRRSACDDTCILAEDCPPVKCTRPNEVWNSCPSGCLAEYCTQIKDQPSTCNELLKNCQPKCICAGGYYRDENDRCIPASDCGETNCGVNKTIVSCTFKCPNQFCPENDSLDVYACKPPRDCPPGCGCKAGYRFKSLEDDTCVLARDCPPVCCTRPNEEWNSCPPPCYSDACKDRNKKQSECYETEGDCNPKCVCTHGYYRNANKTCVPACECD